MTSIHETHEEYKTWKNVADGFPTSGCWRGSRKELKIANRAMRQFRQVPRARHAQFVILTKFVIPKQLRDKALPGFTHSEKTIWLRDYRLAAKLVRLDREIGGHGYTREVEYRHCRVCRKLLIGMEATDYRVKMRMPFDKWETKKGPTCGPDCRPGRKKHNGAS